MIRVLLGSLWTACLLVLCFNIQTDQPVYVFSALFFAFVLGGLFVDTAHQVVRS